MKLSLIGSLIAAMPMFVQGQAKPAATPEQALLQIERDWTQASLKKDAVAFDKILGDDWVGMDFEGKQFTKAQVLSDLKSGANVVQTIELGDMKARVLGNTAIVTGSDVEKSSYKGKDTSGKYAWTDVFMMRGGRWQAVGSQSTKVPK